MTSAHLRAALVVALLCVGAPTANARAAMHADRDHDKVFDDLEADLPPSGTGPVIVSLAVPASVAETRRIEQAVGGLGTITRLRVVDAFTAHATAEQVRALAARADVRHVEEDATVVPFGVSAQTSFGVTRAREDLPELDGRGMTAAVIDSGMDTTMPDLAGGKVIAFKDLVNGRSDPYDDLGHGSLVSEILAGSGAGGAEGRGAAPAAQLVGVKVIDSKAQSSLGVIAQGIQWAVENRERYGIDVLNLSIGDPTGCGDGTDVASQAVDAAVANGLVVVVAAGNAGPAACTIKSPAAAESALTVGAMADTGAGGFSQAWFSSRGPTADGRVKPDISAPGVDVPIPGPGGGLVPGSGTSAAAPFVAGTVLLMLEASPKLTPAAVKDAIERTAIDWGVPGRDNDYGAGRLDAYAALQAVGAPLAVPPAVPSHRTWSGLLLEGQDASAEIEVGGATFPLAATLLGPSVGFELALLDESGAAVGTTTVQPGASRQTDITLAKPVAGRYTVRVRAKTGGGPFVVDLSGSFAPADVTPPALTLDTPEVLTNDPAPMLRGTAGSALGDFPGAVLRVKSGAAVVRRIGIVPVLGRWTAALAPALTDGVYTIEAEEGDAAGNVTTVAGRVTIDTAAPPVPTVAAPAGPVRQVVLSGTAEVGARVEIREGDDRRATTTADVAGTWTSGILAATDGTHTYSVTATDPAGNVSPATQRSVVVDGTPPTVGFESGPPAVIPPGDVTVGFSASEQGVTFECALDAPGGAAGAFAACASPRTLSALEDGAYTFRVRATDTAGNVGVVSSRSWTVATPTPTATPAATATALPGPIATVTPRPSPTPAPVITLTVPRQRLAVVLRSGLSVRLGCAPACRATLVLTQGSRAAATRTISVKSAPLRATLRLSAARRKALARVGRVTLTLTVSAPGARTVVRRVTLTR